MPPADDAAGAGAGRPVRRPETTDDLEDLDPGLAAERTLLAWNRTGLSFMALGGAVVRIAPVAGASIVALGILVWLTGYVERRSGGPVWLGRRTRIRLIAMGTGAVSVVAFVVGLVGNGRV